jgi:hypothetical protein
VALNLRHQTAGQFAARFWRRVDAAQKSGDKLTLHRLIWWVWLKIQAGEITSDQARLSYNTHFGKSLNSAQWTALVTARFVPIKDRYAALIAEADV